MIQKVARLAAVAVGLIAMAAPVSRAAEPAAPAAPGQGAMQIERASADDCEIIVEIGKAKINWGAKAPEYKFFPEITRTDGGTYLEDCPWTELGVAAPVVGTPDAVFAFSISRPVYSGTQATADIAERVLHEPSPDGKQYAPFVEMEICTLEKRGGHWHLVACKLGLIT